MKTASDRFDMLDMVLAARACSDLAFTRITANRFMQLNGRLALRAAPAMHMAWPQIIAAGIILIVGVHFILFGYFLFQTVITSPISDMFTYIADYFAQGRLDCWISSGTPSSDTVLLGRM
jgi:hypothetical protein